MNELEMDADDKEIVVCGLPGSWFWTDQLRDGPFNSAALYRPRKLVKKLDITPNGAKLDLIVTGDHRCIRYINLENKKVATIYDTHKNSGRVCVGLLDFFRGSQTSQTSKTTETPNLLDLLVSDGQLIYRLTSNLDDSLNSSPNSLDSIHHIPFDFYECFTNIRDILPGNDSSCLVLDQHKIKKINFREKNNNGVLKPILICDLEKSLSRHIHRRDRAKRGWVNSDFIIFNFRQYAAYSRVGGLYFTSESITSVTFTHFQKKCRHLFFRRRTNSLTKLAAIRSVGHCR